MTVSLLRVAVVGHTNTGKTSLLRTLTRDAGFGEVSSRPATTRHVEASTLLVDGRPALELFDTPGLEDSTGLLDQLDRIRRGLVLRDGGGDATDAIHAFLDPGEGHAGFSQEAMALRQLLDSDAALYVIDARDRVLGKHRDELEILGRCARPVLPLLNFVADPEARAELWREQLARVNMHAVVAFDSVVFDELGELQLFETLRVMLPRFHPTLDALIADTRRRRAALRQASARLIADLLIDAAAYKVSVPSGDQDRAAAAMADLRQALRDGEQACVDALLELYRFRPGDYLAETLPITDGAWGLDLFSADSLKQFGLSTGGAAATGALAGLGIDAMVGGITLGAAAATGALIGAVIGAARSHGQQLIDSLSGLTELRVGRPALDLLALRQIALVRALLRRGHASQQRLRLVEAERGQDFAPLAEVLHGVLGEAHQRPEWCRLGKAHAGSGNGGRELVGSRLADRIIQSLEL